LSISIQVGMVGLQYGAIGAVAGTFWGGAFGGLDAWAGGNDVWTGMAQGAKYGALFGLAFGAYLGAGPLLLSGGALMTLKIAFTGYAGISTACGVMTADNSLQGGVRLTAGLLMIWGMLSMPTVPVKIEPFGGKTGLLKDYINMDIAAERGIQTDLTQPIPLPSNVSQAVVNNPYINSPSANIMSWLPNVAVVLKPGGRLIINGTSSNRFVDLTNVPLEQYGLRVVNESTSLAPEYNGLIFRSTDGQLIPTRLMKTTILEKNF
jgi:hypothetical protein